MATGKPEIADQLLERGAKAIRSSRSVDLWRPSDARVNAEELLGEVLGKQITTDDLDSQITPAKIKRFDQLVARRVAGEPVALILGYTEFRKLKLIVRKGVFVPRNTSELMAEKAIARLRSRRNPVAVDVATGTGPVALAIADGAKNAEVYGLDIWRPSLVVARQNASQLGLKVHFILSDLLAKLPRALEGKVDVFTCHPPYVARSQLRGLPKEIKDFEPRVSLSDNSVDGLSLVRRLAQDSPGWLRRGGWLLFEISPDLSRQVATIMRRSGFERVKSERDSLGATRVVSGRWP
ncbi:MAG: peptide chain release factor N(5)-glutamine methyltransferase [Actinomycetota bacterium]